jgi:non-canonical (house-cleaning) NTP pyrophosphatase
MKINVGSKNLTKIRAVEESVALYPDLFPDPEVVAVDVDVELYGHPKSINETVDGAIDRAKKAFSGCDYSFGIEGGLNFEAMAICWSRVARSARGAYASPPAPAQVA